MYIADLHIHSKYSRATSRDGDLPHLDYWARRKGIALVGTGDFTHPAWRQELEERLGYATPAELTAPESWDTQVLEAFYKIRQLPQIKKKPSTSEIIDWIQALVHGGVDPRRVVKEVPYLGVLLKKNEDMDALRRNWR